MKKETPVRKKGISFQAFIFNNRLASDGRNLFRNPNTETVKIVNMMNAMTRTDQPKPILGSK